MRRNGLRLAACNLNMSAKASTANAEEARAEADAAIQAFDQQFPNGTLAKSWQCRCGAAISLQLAADQNWKPEALQAWLKSQMYNHCRSAAHRQATAARKPESGLRKFFSPATSSTPLQLLEGAQEAVAIQPVQAERAAEHHDEAEATKQCCPRGRRRVRMALYCLSIIHLLILVCRFSGDHTTPYWCRC